MSPQVKVVVDRDECIQCGVCWSECPEVFEESPEDGLTQITETYRSGDDLGAGAVPGDLEDCARNGAEACPVEIIHVG